MLTNFISEAAETMDRPVLISTDSETYETKQRPAIRINVRSIPTDLPPVNICDRARKIYFRARKSNRMSRAAGIF
jgi:hypothetical protein